MKLETYSDSMRLSGYLSVPDPVDKNEIMN